jgi:conjugative transfer signal peptidase TraF
MAAALGLLAVGFVCYAAGLRINTTRSIPIGIYRLSDVPVGKGEYVIFCPPQTALFDEARERGYIGAGFCPGNYGYMMKRVLATGNDRVVSTEEGLRINGGLLLSSKPLKTDKAGRMMPRYSFNHYRRGKSELLLMSDVKRYILDGAISDRGSGASEGGDRVFGQLMNSLAILKNVMKNSQCPSSSSKPHRFLWEFGRVCLQIDVEARMTNKKLAEEAFQEDISLQITGNLNQEAINEVFPYYRG